MPLDDARERLLAQYLDGSLIGEGRDAFAQRIAHDPVLRAEVESLQRAEETLRRNFTHSPTVTSATILAMAATLAPANDTIAVVAASRSHAASIGSVARSSAPSWLRKLGVAAAFAAGIFGLWMVWEQVRPDPTASLIHGPPPAKTASAYYNTKVADGFEPDWVCNDDAQFTSTFVERFGQGLALKPSAGNTRMLGIDYAPVLTPLTLGVLGESDGKAILVLIDKLENDNRDSIYVDCASLRVYRREMGSLVLYELNTLPEARMLDLFVQPQ